MSDPGMSEEELRRLTRAYLNRRTARTPPPEFEQRLLESVVTARQRNRVAGVLGAVALVGASVVAAAVVLAVHNSGARLGAAGSSPAPTQVAIVRTPGNLVLPPVDRTITDAQMAARLAADIESLPPFPPAERCPIDFGTTYTLTFVLPDGSSWTATVAAQGCQVVHVASQPTQWAMHSPGFWDDLTTALGLTQSQVLPPVCLGPTRSGCAPINSSST